LKRVEVQAIDRAHTRTARNACFKTDAVISFDPRRSILSNAARTVCPVSLRNSMYF